MNKILNILALVLSVVLLSQSAYAVSSETKTLYSNASFTSTANGSSVCLPRLSDDFVFYLKAINGAGSSPTLDVKVQHSDDESNWVDLDGMSFTQATSGTSTQFKQLNSAAVHVLRCVRVVATIGGTSSPSYDVTVKAHYRIRN